MCWASRGIRVGCVETIPLKRDINSKVNSDETSAGSATALVLKAGSPELADGHRLGTRETYGRSGPTEDLPSQKVWGRGSSSVCVLSSCLGDHGSTGRKLRSYEFRFGFGGGTLDYYWLSLSMSSRHTWSQINLIRCV